MKDDWQPPDENPAFAQPPLTGTIVPVDRPAFVGPPLFERTEVKRRRRDAAKRARHDRKANTRRNK